MHRRTIALALPMLSLPSLARAHHGWGSYASDQPKSLVGTVEQVSFENPHGILILKSPEKVWETVLAPPFRMIGRGLEESRIRPGETVVVMGHPHRAQVIELRAEWIKVKDAITQRR